jgi:hypothetical protein
MSRITVTASYPDAGSLNLVFTPPLQTWRFPGYAGGEAAGRRAVLDACRDAVREHSEKTDSPPVEEIETAVETVLAALVAEGRITTP